MLQHRHMSSLVVAIYVGLVVLPYLWVCVPMGKGEGEGEGEYKIVLCHFQHKILTCSHLYWRLHVNSHEDTLKSG